MSIVALSELLGATVRDASGAVKGRVREIAVAPQDHPTRVAFLIVRTSEGERAVPAQGLKSAGATVRTDTDSATWERYAASDGVLLLKRDLLDQQIIDVHGRKVVRVNDVEFDSTPVNSHLSLHVTSVDVGARGAIRRLAMGVVPSFTLRALLDRIPPRVIPWQFVDLLETDPARRVKLKIAYKGLSRLHPADIADIVEEMDPDAAADLLENLPADRSGEILKEMQPEEREEVSQLLEFGERTAAGRMTTEFIALPETGVVDDAIEALRAFEGSREALATIYLTGESHKLTGAVPLVTIAISSPAAQLSLLSEPHISCAPDTPDAEVAALFDKYNLVTLAVADEHGRIAGIITADDVITMLRHRR